MRPKVIFTITIHACSSGNPSPITFSKRLSMAEVKLKAIIQNHAQK